MFHIDSGRLVLLAAGLGGGRLLDGRRLGQSTLEAARLDRGGLYRLNRQLDTRMLGGGW